MRKPAVYPTTRLPRYLQVEAAGACNLRCEMCAIRVRKDNRPEAKAYMQPDLFRRIVDGMVDLDRLHLQGLGEPLLNPHFFAMASYAAGKGIEVTASSNLALLEEKKAELLVASGLACLHVSVDGATASTYEAIRKGASFPGLLANIRLLNRVKDRTSSSRLSVRMTVVLMRRNLRELPGLVELASDLGMEQIFVQHLCHSFGESTLPARYAPMRDFVRMENLATLPSDLVEECFDRARETAAGRGIELRLPASQAARTRRRRLPSCDWPWTGIYVSYQGYVMPCCMVSTPDRINFGRAGGHDIADIWNGGAFTAFRTRLSSADPPEICRYCSVYSGTF